jgi:cytoskeletal protein CcmA (bactofilin family)
MDLDIFKRKLRQDHQAMPDEEIVALLEPGVEIEGKIKVTSGMVRLNCQFKGMVCSEGTIIVASQGDIEADLEATQISIAGKVKGNVHASKQLQLKEHSILLGDVETPSLVIDPGAYFTGRCNMPTHGIEKLARDEVHSGQEEA